MKNVYCIGELLIDFVATQQGNDLSKATDFSKKAGGAPANVAAAIAKLNGSGYFVGCVGKDPFGTFLLHTLDQGKVNTSLTQLATTFTTLAFVSLAEDGERDFVFSRGADQKLRHDPSLINQFKNQIIHFGAATAFLGGELEDTYTRYLQDAVLVDAFISFDPNFRTDLWKGKEATFVEKCLPFIEKAHLAKFSLEEAQLISGKQDLQEACAFLHRLGAETITITLGKEGTYLSTATTQKTIPSISVNPVDTTGAGDAFIGCLLYQISKLENTSNHRALPFSTLEEMVLIANKAGAITTTNYGAIESLPTQNQLDRL